MKPHAQHKKMRIQCPYCHSGMFIPKAMFKQVVKNGVICSTCSLRYTPEHTIEASPPKIEHRQEWREKYVIK